jgi:hypothetical protein
VTVAFGSVVLPVAGEFGRVSDEVAVPYFHPMNTRGESTAARFRSIPVCR